MKINRRGVRLTLRLLRESKEGGSSGKKRHLETELANLRVNHVRLKDNAIVGAGAGGSDKVVKKVKWKDIESAFKGRIRTGTVINVNHDDIDLFFKDAFTLAGRRIKRAVNRMGIIKVNFIFCGDYIKPTEPHTLHTKFFNTKNFLILANDDIGRICEEAIDKLKNKMDEFQQNGSGFTLKSINYLAVNIVKCRLLKS